MDRDEVEVHKLAKKRTRPISSHLDRTNLVNKGFIIWLLGKFCLRDTAGSPEWERWLHLARSGLPAVSRKRAWSYLARSGLPAVSRKQNYPESHIINPLLTKFARWRWLDIGLVLFCEFMDLDFVSAINLQKKNLANIQPSWPHTWSITHTSWQSTR